MSGCGRRRVVADPDGYRVVLDELPTRVDHRAGDNQRVDLPPLTFDADGSVVSGGPVFGQPAVGDTVPVALASRETPPCRRHHAIERSRIRCLRQDPNCNSVALVDDRLDRHPELALRRLARRWVALDEEIKSSTQS